MKFEPNELVELARLIATRLAPPTLGPELVSARTLGVSPRAWRSALRSGELRGYRIGRELLARREDAARWLEAHRIDARTEDRSSVAAEHYDVDDWANEPNPAERERKRKAWASREADRLLAEPRHRLRPVKGGRP